MPGIVIFVCMFNSSSLATSSMNECNLRQFLNPLLQGIVVFIRTYDVRDFKERIINLDPSLLKITWVSTNPNKMKLHQLYLKDITVSMMIKYDG